MHVHTTKHSGRIGAGAIGKVSHCTAGGGGLPVPGVPPIVLSRGAGLDLLARAGEFGGEGPLVRQGQAVFGGEDGVRETIEGIVSDSVILGGAEDQPDGRILVGQGPMLARIVEVEVHLSGIGMRERAELQLDHHEATQAAVAGDEGETATEFEEEGFEVADQCGFQIMLGEIVAEVEKFEDEGVFEGGGGEGVSGASWDGTGYAAITRELAPLVVRVVI